MIWTKVVTYHRLFNKFQNWKIGAHTKKLVLECGHTSIRKGSIKVPKVARCRECEDIKNQDHT